jgi:hypothetical protein
LFSQDEWLLPVFLLVLSIASIVDGAFRLAQLEGGVTISSENSRFFNAPISVVFHTIIVTIYCILGAFQFASEIRHRKPRRHSFSAKSCSPVESLRHLQVCG